MSSMKSEIVSWDFIKGFATGHSGVGSVSEHNAMRLWLLRLLSGHPDVFQHRDSKGTVESYQVVLRVGDGRVGVWFNTDGSLWPDRFTNSTISDIQDVDARLLKLARYAVGDIQMLISALSGRFEKEESDD